MITNTTVLPSPSERTVDERWAGWIAERARRARQLHTTVAIVAMALPAMGLVAWFLLSR
jgi:hypothetical protein